MVAETLLIIVGAFAGGSVNALAGFGTGMTALVLWLHARPGTVATTLLRRSLHRPAHVPPP
ncbi:MAG: hypothetical protein ACK4TL_01220 [Hyphomicrobiaceae bacterium]